MSKRINRMITKKDYDAALFDLDGVITRTAKVHATAWKELFDGFLEKKAQQDNSDWTPFDPVHDYQEYVDGKPRYEGVKSFLKSRKIELPWGDPSDPPGYDTICALGNMKNTFFQKNLKKLGVEIFDDAVFYIKKIRSEGFKTAVVSSSKNCSAVLETAGLSSLFDEQVDGIVSERTGLKGKPDPDIFIEAAKRLDVAPARSVVFEDALSGVEAGRRGNFGLVVGVDRTGHGDELVRKGAHIVVKDMNELIPDQGDNSHLMMDKLPSALEKAEEIIKMAKGKKLFIALDYDGTLTPIVERPDMALMSEEMRDTVKKLASKRTVAVISGRDLEDVRKLVQIDNIIYAGSHGFDISSMEGEQKGFQMGTDILPDLEKAEAELRKKLGSIKGSLVERKKFSIAVHYRMVEDSETAEVERIVDEVLSGFSSLVKGTGKKVFELKPDIEWDKGKALLWVMKALGLDFDNSLTMYIGDDTTDEDAFRELKNKGTGIIVRDGDKNRKTFAGYYLNNTSEVQAFLMKLAELS